MQRDMACMGIGVALPSSGPFATADNIFAVAEAVSDQDPNFFESLTTLAAVGGRARRIGLAVHGLRTGHRRLTARFQRG